MIERPMIHTTKEKTMRVPATVLPAFLLRPTKPEIAPRDMAAMTITANDRRDE